MNMNRSWVGLVGAVLVGTALVAGLRAQERQAAPPRQAAGDPGRVVFTFADEAQLRAFAQLWNQRERALSRLSTLQEYWASEQQAMTQLNQRLAAEYHVDPAKSYVLDPDHKLLLERPSLPATELGKAKQGSPDAAGGGASPAP